MARPEDTHHLVIDSLTLEFPGFKRLLAASLEKGVTVERGVILIGHLPDQGPRAYLHYIYPPVRRSEKLWAEHFDSPMPSCLRPLFRLINGATLFHTCFDLWGFRIDADDFRNPAFDLRERNEATSRGWYKFGSSNCDDFVTINERTGRVRLTIQDEAEPQEFSDINDWLDYQGEIGDGVFQTFLS